MADVRGRLGALVDRALLDEEDPTALGLLRVLVVSILLLSVLTHIGAVADYFSSDSVLNGTWARRSFHSRWSLFFYVDDPWAVRGLFALGVLAHACWLVGLFTTPAAVISFGLWVSMVGRNPLLYSLPDQLQVALAFVLMWLPSGRGLSLDASWRQRGGPVPSWCRRLVQLQLAVLYVGTGLLKTGSTWRADGTALYYSLMNPYNRHFDIAPLLAFVQPWLLRPMTWLVLVWEVSFGAFVALHWTRDSLARSGRTLRWLPDLRAPFLGFGVLTHVMIQALMYVAWFTPLVLAAYASFLSPAEARQLVARVTRRRFVS